MVRFSDINEKKVRRIADFVRKGGKKKVAMKKFGYTRKIIDQCCAVHGVESAHLRPGAKPKELKAMARLREKGLTYEQLGERFGISESGARHRVTKFTGVGS